MMRAAHATFLFLASALAMAADIRLPEPKTPDLPDPPTPGPISKLEANQLYVVESDKPLLVLDSPQGTVKVNYSPGPVVVRAEFVNGAGPETRTYKGPHVYMVEAAKSGKVELILIPHGAEKIEDVVRVSLDVDAGEGPRPPPKPDDDPAPKPKPKPEPVESFRVIFITDPLKNLPIGQNAAIYGQQVTDYLNANTTKDGDQPGWRRFTQAQKVVDDHPTIRALWDAILKELTVTPAVAIEVNGKVVIENLPANQEAMLALLKKYRGN